MIYVRNWENILCVILAEAKETVENRAGSTEIEAWYIVNVEDKVLRHTNFKSSHLRYLGDEQLYIFCQNT
jgi:hypothetical protein